MFDSIDLSLILPAYNERTSIASTINSVFAYFRERAVRVEVIVAADGNDGTRELVREMMKENLDLKVIGHENRSGKGRGIREAIALARGSIIGYVDADNKVPVEEYQNVQPWLNAGYDVVIGSRGLEQSKIERYQPWYRRLGAVGFYYFMQAVVGLPGFRDTQCGFKFFQRAAAFRLFQLQRIDGYMFDVEILALARRLGYSVKAVPIRWRDDGDSRLDLLSGNLRNVIDIFKIRFYLAELNERPAATAVSDDDEHQVAEENPPAN